MVTANKSQPFFAFIGTSGPSQKQFTKFRSISDFLCSGTHSIYLDVCSGTLSDRAVAAWWAGLRCDFIALGLGIPNNSEN
jgi:hypothetical protein